jgi:hypothetical protein
MTATIRQSIGVTAAAVVLGFAVPATRGSRLARRCRWQSP